jgi:hypothetical protein
LNSYEEVKGYENVSEININPNIETELGDFSIGMMERVSDYIVFSCSDNCLRVIKMPRAGEKGSSGLFSYSNANTIEF